MLSVGFQLFGQVSELSEVSDSTSTIVNKKDDELFVVIEGVILSKESGEYPVNDNFHISINSLQLKPDSIGNFSCNLPYKKFYSITISSNEYKDFTQAIPINTNKLHYFITCILEKENKKQLKKPFNQSITKNELTTGLSWEISGCITDSRFDVAIDDDSLVLTFDGEPVSVHSKGRYLVSTKYSGTHTLHLSIPGYHEIFDQITLTSDEKRVYHVISTTKTSYKNKRREMIVSAKRQPLHQKSEVSKIIIPRYELLNATATMNDPIRVLQTLPGVASETDASARPIVRGGDVLEARVFLDGIPLIQPYHFGGAHSTLNQAAITNLSIYKSGFPAKYHNAQSAIITAESRNPLDDTLSINFDLNPLQYDFYLGLPLFDKKAGVFFQSQGSFQDAIFKGALSLVSTFMREGGKKQVDRIKRSIHLPDYRDIGGGLIIKPNDKIKFQIMDSYNSDKCIISQIDSVQPITYYYDNKYYLQDPLSNKILLYNELTGNSSFDASLKDTSFSILMSPSVYYPETENEFAEWNAPYSVHFEDTWVNPYDRYQFHKGYIDVDTIIDYRSRYNLLYGIAQYIPNKDNIINFRGAWQRRWWDLNFPDEYSSFLKNSIYDVVINQGNLYVDWSYSGNSKHLINSGIQLDYTHASYDVYTVRAIHELITKGSTNWADFWGPITGDTAFAFNDTSDDSDKFMYNMIDRIFVRYDGYKSFLNGNLFIGDEWNVTKNIKLNLGARLEVSSLDTSITLTPRISGHFKIKEKNEITAAIGLYTQNNYDIAAMALSTELKPEKVWHTDLGLETQYLPWLGQKVSVYGKYYYDLISERIDPVENLSAETVDSLMQVFFENNSDSSLSVEDFINAYILEHGNIMFKSTYSNSGKGHSFGIEYFLRFDPTDYWFGWISFSLGKSMRQRHPGWKWHLFSLDRPVLFSLVNFYRLPRKYEIGIKYRYMFGLPYTEVEYKNGFKIGNYNAKRYVSYHRIDMRISRGFSVRERVKGHFYFEVWNMMNIPNIFSLDSETKKVISMNFNIPTTAIFFGLDMAF